MSKFRKNVEKVEKLLQTEIQLTNELIKKNSNRFRNDHGHKTLKMTVKSLNRFLEANLCKLVKDFEDNFPIISEFLNANERNVNHYLPSLEMCEFLVKRVIAVFSLLVKVCQVYCLKSGDFAIKRLHLGHFWTVGLNNLASTAKMCQLSVDLLDEMQILYMKIHPLLNILGCENLCQYPSQLSEDLDAKSWLKIELDKRFKLETEKKGKNNEVGLIVEREKVTKQIELPCKKDHWLKICSTFNNINNPNELIKFSEEEHLNRKKDRKSCVSKLMHKTSWKELKMVIAMKCQKMKKKELHKFKDRIIIWLLYPDSRGENDKTVDLWNKTAKRNLASKFNCELT